MDIESFAPPSSALRAALAGLVRAIDLEIRTYPTPIPRCDAQFNHLYDLRARIARLIPLIDGPSKSDRDRAALIEALNDVLSTSPASDNAAEQALRERLRDLLGGIAASG